jgi:hypothetical protein
MIWFESRAVERSRRAPTSYEAQPLQTPLVAVATAPESRHAVVTVTRSVLLYGLRAAT